VPAITGVPDAMSDVLSLVRMRAEVVCANEYSAPHLAAEHLRTGTVRIGEITALVGYGSEAALTRAFKAQFNTTPAAFRRTGRTRPTSPRSSGEPRGAHR
jgi:AraC-like DNA-binding protein